MNIVRKGVQFSRTILLLVIDNSSIISLNQSNLMLG